MEMGFFSDFFYHDGPGPSRVWSLIRKCVCASSHGTDKELSKGSAVAQW